MINSKIIKRLDRINFCTFLSDAYSRRLNARSDGKALVQNANIPVNDRSSFCVTRFLLRKLSNKLIFEFCHLEF